MAKVTGFACDVCNQFGTSQGDRLPLNWLRIETSTSFEGRVDANSFHLCSNACLSKLAKARMQAEKDGTVPSLRKTAITSSGKRQVSPEGRQQMRENGLKLAHSKGSHDENPVEDCPSCIEALLS